MKTTNNNIDLQRLSRLLVYENKSSRYIYKITLFGAILLVFVMLMRVLNHAANEEARLIGPIFRTLSNDMLVFIISISPFIFYYRLFKKRYKHMYATLPASNIEKYISLLINTLIVAPVTILIAKMCIDFIASGFSMKHFIFFDKWDLMNLINQRELNLLHYVITLWGAITINTLFLFIFTQCKIWQSILIIVLITITEINLIETVFDIVIDDKLTPTGVVEGFEIIALINIAVLQPIIYLFLKRIKA